MRAESLSYGQIRVPGGSSQGRHPKQRDYVRTPVEGPMLFQTAWQEANENPRYLRCPICACARAVLTARLSVARSYVPTCRCPLTKKLGVPATTLTSALSTSDATRSLHR